MQQLTELAQGDQSCALTTRALWCRQVAEIYTRATVPLVDDDCESMEDREPSYQQERFILSIVEETLHAKPLFACQVHEMRDEHKRQAQVCACLPLWPFYCRAPLFADATVC